MPWYAPWSDLIKKKVCRYLLQRYLGQFLDKKLSLEQLNVDLYNGKGTVYNVTLYNEALNELCESQGWGIEVTGGRIGSVTVTIPWNALMTDDSYIEISGFYVSIRPRARPTDGTSMFESMWSSMSSSMQLAQECLEKEGDISANAQNATIEGLEKFAQTIDSVLNRIKAKFIDTEIRLEYLPSNSDRGIAIIVKIDKLEYQNEAGGDPPDKPPESEYHENVHRQKTQFISTYAIHHISMEGITFYTEEFRVSKPKKQPTTTESMTTGEQFYSTISQLPETEQIIASEKLKRTDTESDNSDSDAEDDKRTNKDIYHTDKVMFGKLVNKQEIRIKIKQAENITGPKVYLELSLGAFFIFLSPRQLHMIISFADAFFNDDQVSKAEAKNKQQKQQKQQEQKSREMELQKENLQKRFNAMAGVVGLNQGFWSDPIDDNNHSRQQKPHGLQDEDLREIPKQLGLLGESVISSSSSMTSSMCSSSISSSTANSSKSRRRYIDTDPNADISHYNMRVAFLTIVLLHEEILVEYLSQTGETYINEQSISKLLMLSDHFFSNCQNINIGLQAKDVTNAGKLLDKCCNKNHLRLMLSPIILEGEEQRNVNGILLKFTASVARADFREVLQEVSVPLIEFFREETHSGLSERPEVTLSLKQTTPVIKGSGGKRFAPPTTELNFSITQCLAEFDISIFDRLSAIFNSSPFKKDDTNSQGSEGTLTPNNRYGEPKTDITIDSPYADVRLRFPIADSRPIHDPDRVPWWKQNVRPDFILLNFQQFRFKYLLPSLIEIEANEIDIHYCENLNSPKIHLGKSILKDNSGSRFSTANIEYPKISIEFPSEEVLKSLIRKNTDDNGNGQTAGDSSNPTILTQKHKESSPFSSKRVCRESDTPHSKQYTDDPETLIIPGDTEEMKNFCENAMKTSKLQIKIVLPVVSLQLSSKHLYEVIYNRINNDLLMWEPSAPSTAPRTTNFKQNLADSLFNVGMMDSIYAPFPCANETSYDSNSPTDESGNECESDNVYFSLYERKRTKRPVQSAPVQTSSTCSFQLNVNQGILTLYAPVRDTQNRVIPGQYGEFTTKVNSMYLFSVSGYCGNENLAYLCLQSKAAELYHCGLIPKPMSEEPPRLVNYVLPVHAQSTLYPTPPNLTLNESKGSSSREMLSLAIQIKAMPEQHLKRVRVAAGFQNTTLRHHPAVSQHTWLTQLLDIFDVLDYPIEGYTPYGIVTEMHLHLWDCSIDYRPLYLPYRAVATLGTFMISSNLTSASPGCTLRFVAEDCSLCLAPHDLSNGDKKRNLENKITAEPSTDLVCVLDLGLFEISLRLNDKATASFPKFDLRASINDIHIRTCSDSGQALAQLIAYLASDGDLNKSNDELGDNAEQSSPMSSNRAGEDELLPMKQPTHVVPEVSPMQQERVNTLMAEAMQESLRSVSQSGDEDGNFDQGVKIFFFPDETIQSNTTLPDKSPEQGDDEESSLGKNENLPVDDETKSLQDDGDNSLSGSGTEFSSNRRTSEDTDSVNTEMRDLLNFENTVMDKSYMGEDSVVEALPDVKKELGEVPIPVPKAKGASGVSRKISSDTDEDFCFVAEEEKAKCVYERVEVSEEPIRIIDNHFSVPIGKPDLLKAPQSFPMAVMRYTLCEMTLTWHMYGGSDFQASDEQNKWDRDAKEHIVRFSTLPMSEAYKLGVSYSKGSPNVQFGRKKLSKLSWKTRGGLGRKHDVLMEIQISKVRFSHETYPAHTKQASRQVLLVTELEIRDRLQVSQINKFLYHPSVNQRPKKGSQHMVVIKALHVRPNASLPAQECCLRISLLPLRLNIDQDSLLFLVQFFNELGTISASGQSDSIKKHSTPTHQPPVMMVDDIPEAVQDLQARKMVSENLMLLMDEEEKEKEIIETACDTNEDIPIYFREVDFSPDVPIRLDYHGKRIELSRGPLAGLLMGLGQLQCSEIRLKKICHKHGLLGVDRLLNFLFQEWLHDIKKNQLQSLLSGVGPMYTLVQLFQGIRDLFWLPIEQYQKDGRIVRGLQLGAQSFTARTALAALEITTRLIQLLQFTAETAYDMVSPGPSVRRGRYNRKGKRKRMHPPQDIREGVANAYQIVKEGIGDTAHTLVEVTAVEHDQKGYTGAVGAVVRQIPPIVVRPIVLATQATTNVLGGVKNQLVPDARIEAREKWKEDDE